MDIAVMRDVFLANLKLAGNANQATYSKTTYVNPALLIAVGALMEYAQKLPVQQIVYLAQVQHHVMLASMESTGMEENVLLVTQDVPSVTGQKFAHFVIHHIN